MNETVIAVEQLSKEYKFGMAVDGVSFQIRKKGIYGLVGPNGAGKTTIMKMLGGLVHPSAGTIHMYGDAGELQPEQARRYMSFIIEQPYLQQGATAYQNLEKMRLMKGLPDRERIHQVLELTGLGDVNPKKHVRKYSLGMKQRLGIAGALLSDPSVLVLDEPINGLDPEGIIEVRELLLNLNRERGVTMLISSHILTELSHLCTDYLFINHGRIVKSITHEELKESAEDLEEYYLSVIAGKE
ncbi:MAG: ABC transporter ATP-binding protein [Lachnospiraceae bacterium]|nr:ABC transporter ATP-binding protein [Lachnospiraceae bacterium]